MCGILGCYGYSPNEEYTKKFRYALGLLKHRGPDNLQIFQNRKVILGHTRLSIIDLSESANQPLADTSSRYWIVLNGEIYNYLEIRQELQRRGVSFHTESDAEVVLEAYKAWGSDCLYRFNGMWAFAIYDTQKTQLFLSRDRYGVKPLYYSMQDNRLCFASELKALLALGIKPEPNWEQIGCYLKEWGCDTGSDTVFKHIHSLPPGYFIRISPDGYNTLKWWDIWNNRVQVPARFEDRVKQFQELFEDSVRLRLRNDVDTGVCLSGGIDSSAVYGAARKLQKMKVARSATSGKDKLFRVFSVSYPGSPIDEYPWVNKCLEFWDDQEQSSVVYPKPEIFPELIDEIIWHQEAPVWSASVFAFHILYRHIGSLGTKVVLEGHGSDEMLGGYPYMVQAAVQSFAARRNLRLAWNAANCLVDTKNPALQEVRLPAWCIFLNAFLFSGRLLTFSSWVKKKLNYALGSQMRGSYINPELVNAGPLIDTAGMVSSTKLNQELNIAFTQRILPIVLRVFDRATMAYGVESRAPFMDYRIVQFIFSLREEDKIARVTKHILRSAAENWVPREVINRKAKLGFSIEEREWFCSDIFRTYLADTFNSADALNSNLFSGRLLARDLDRCLKSGFSWQDTKRIWEVLNIYLWHKRFVKTAPII